MGLPTIVQYWRSFDHLEAFANDADDPHSAAWRNYWKRVGKDNRTGIWHETYLVRAGEYEAVYANMPPFGLGKAATLVPVTGATSARGRIKTRRRMRKGRTRCAGAAPSHAVSAQPSVSPVSGWNACSSPVRTPIVSTSPMRGGTRPSKRTTRDASRCRRRAARRRRRRPRRAPRRA